jgi:phage recombination protein Bet
MTKETNTKIARASGFASEDVALIKETVAKGTTDSELALFLFTAREAGLSPLLKEIWCYRDGKSNLIIFSGRDGFLKSAQNNKNFNGIRSSEVRENDEFSLDIANNKITHLKKFPTGKIIGAYAIAFRKEGEPTIEWVDFEPYNKGYSAWKTHPADMIKKVAETHALKKAFGISALQSEFDFDVDQHTGKAYAIDTNEPCDLNTVGRIQRLLNSSTLDEDHKTKIESELGTVGNARAEELIEMLNANQLDEMEMSVYNQGAIDYELDKKMENERA